MEFDPYLSKMWSTPQAHTYDFYKNHGGYQASQKACTMEGKDVINLVKDANLRGRGGAGFPCGLKWSFIPQDGQKPVYLAVNADESEPGTFKDKYLLHFSPHILIEGIIIACHAVNAQHAFIYIRGEFHLQAKRVQKAIDEAQHELLKPTPIKITIVRGAGAYICGEETGMLSSIEGDRGNPKLKPPFPATCGLFDCPTVINNVETICHLPFIINNGTKWFTSIGTPESPGSKLFCIHGHVNKAGVVEVPLGYPLKDMIQNNARGVWKDRKLKAVIPGGSSAPILTADEAYECLLSYEGIQQKGSMLGSGAITILDETVDIVDLAWNVMRFYHHESCGQCTPCREGTGWLDKLVGRIAQNEGRSSDLDLLEKIFNSMTGRTICALADAAVMPMRSYLEKFREEFEAKIKPSSIQIPVIPSSSHESQPYTSLKTQ